MPSLDASRLLVRASLLILLPEQSPDIRLFAFPRPPYGEQVRRRIQRLLQHVRLLIQRVFEVADEIQPPIDECRLGIALTRRLRRVLFALFSFPKVIEP